MHGGAEHWGKMRTKMKEVAGKLKGVGKHIDFNKVRTNQTPVDASGNKVSNLRPDVQFFDNEGNLRIIEVQVRQSDKSFDEKMKSLRAIFMANGWKGTFNGKPFP